MNNCPFTLINHLKMRGVSINRHTYSKRGAVAYEVVNIARTPQVYNIKSTVIIMVIHKA